MDASPPRRPSREGLEYLGAVAAGLVHEIRNPLSTMNITLQLLQEDWEGAEQESRAARTMKRLTSLRREVTRLEAILDDFLRYAGIRRLDLTEVDLNRVVEEVVAFTLPEARSLQIDLTHFPDHDLPFVRLDERLVKQALLNLLLNALQALEGVADATGPRQVIVRCRREGEWARVDVLDTGRGISADLQERIFEIYYSSRPGGTGLGLPTARRIAEEHGGGLVCQSEAGRGSMFVLRLPLRGPTMAASPSRAETVPAPHASRS